MNESRIAIFASGSGSNAEAIIKYFAGHPTIKVVLVLTNNPHAGVLERATKLGVPSAVFSKDQFNDSVYVLNLLEKNQVTHIVLAGFLWMIPVYLVRAFSGHMVNIHPSLLPKFGGKGMYGMKVHEAVKSSGDRQTGITIHLVNEKYDDGKILFQSACSVEESDSTLDIASKVQRLEHQYFPEVIEKWVTEK